MNKIKLVTIITITLVVLASILGYIWNKQGNEQPITKFEVEEQNQIKQENTKEPSPEDLIARSAAEMQNPGGNRINTNEISAVSWEKGTSQNTTSQNVEWKDVICKGELTGVFSCYQKHYENLVKNFGVKEAFSDLRKRYNTDTYVVGQCHPLAHVIGNSAVIKYNTVSEAYTVGDSFCWSGYYHGVLEGIVAKIGHEKVISQMNNICSDVPGKNIYSFEYYNCVHGLGHGLMALTNTELIESLKLCDNLSGSWEQSSCYGGVYMENVIVDNKNHFTKYLKSSDPLYPCNVVEGKYKSACYLMQTSYMLKVTNGDFSKVFDLCEQADPEYKATCFQSLGRDASGRSVSNKEQTKTTCMLGKTFEAQSNCVIGAAKDFVSYFHSDTQAKDLCNSLEDQLKNVCLSTVEEYYKSF